MESITGIPGSVLLAAMAVYVLAGWVKGTIGIGLPTAGVSLTAQFTDVRTAIALALMPMILTNVWQVFRTRHDAHKALQFWPLAVCMLLGILVFAYAAPKVPTKWATLLLGTTVLLFAIVSLIKELPKLSNKHDKKIQVAAGISAGFMGGITGVWAPPMVMYMSAARVDKATFVAVVGVLLMLGSVVLSLTYSRVGLLNQGQTIASLILVIPAILGFALGEKVRSYVDEELFKKLVLLFFFVMGLNLIRRGLGF